MAVCTSHKYILREFTFGQNLNLAPIHNLPVLNIMMPESPVFALETGEHGLKKELELDALVQMPVIVIGDLMLMGA